MRADAAKILLHMGYALDRDFVALEDADKGVFVKWLSQAPQPDGKAIDAAALELATVEQAEEAKRIESNTARDDAKRALAALDTIITGIDGATLTQAKTAIRQLAQIQRHIILATLGR